MDFTPEFILKRIIQQDNYVAFIRASDKPQSRKDELIGQALIQKDYFFNLLKAYNKPKNKVLLSGICECVYEPNGAGGMEGFSCGQEYKFEHMSHDKNGLPYYRIYHVHDYYETTGKGMFKHHFKKIKNNGQEKN